jgi:hypothetical protein
MPVTDMARSHNRLGILPQTVSVFAFDLFLALAVTAFGAAIAWFLVGGFPLIGIDDAAITRSYSENIAAGHGYVYNVGGERVEGSTTILWALIVAGLYLLTSTPEPLIVLTCAGLTGFAVLCALRIVRHLAEAEGVEGTIAVTFVAVLLLASPGYFAWTVWTMMELALWSALVGFLVLTLVNWVRMPRGIAPVSVMSLLVAAALLPLVRPEGVAVAIGLLSLGLLLAPRRRGWIAIAIGAAGLSFVAVTTWRVAYFGQPFPNTFYAKVSSDRAQDLADGAKYTLSFLLGNPFTEILFVAWVAGASLVAVRWLRDRTAERALLIPAATVFGFLMVYAALGGDHFALWRFFQPLQPLLPAAAAVGVGVAIARLAPSAKQLAIPAIGAASALLLVGWPHYYQARFDLRKEFELNAQGIEFGTFLNELEPRPAIGVGPAGGIALSYEGYIYDLLGLNWTEMAHAEPVKIGKRNHASFYPPLFWEHSPDLFALFARPCGVDGRRADWTDSEVAFDGIWREARFRETYLPVHFRDGDRCWPGFARTDWIGRMEDAAAVDVLTWTPLGPTN